MKKINFILVFAIVIVTVLIIIKIINQNIVIEKRVKDISKEQLDYEVQREFEYSEKGKYSEVRDDGVKVNTSADMKKEQSIEDDLIVKNFNLEYELGYTYIEAEVINNSDTEKGGYPIKLVLKDESNEEIRAVNVYLNKIDAKSEGVITTSVAGDISDLYKIDVVNN